MDNKRCDNKFQILGVRRGHCLNSLCEMHIHCICVCDIQWSLISTNTLSTKFQVKLTHLCRAPIETVQNFTA